MQMRRIVVGVFIVYSVLFGLMTQGEDSVETLDSREEVKFSVAGKKVCLTSAKKIVAHVNGKKLVLWVRRYKPIYREDQPYLKNEKEADFGTPEGCHFAEVSSNTVDWFMKCYTVDSRKRMDATTVKKQIGIKKGNQQGVFFEFHYRLEFAMDGKQYALLFYGIDDKQAKEGMGGNGVLWYFGYVKTPNGWKRDISLASMMNLDKPQEKNPIAHYVEEHLKQIEQIAESIRN